MPLPWNDLRASGSARTAFRLMQAAGQIGKILLIPVDAAPSVAAPEA